MYARILVACAFSAGSPSHGGGAATGRPICIRVPAPMPTWFRRRFTAPMWASWSRKTDGRISAPPTNTLGWTPLAALLPGKPYAARGVVAEVQSLFAHIYREASVTEHAPLITVPFETGSK